MVWFKVDFIVGNLFFIGDKRFCESFGVGYVEVFWKVYFKMF